MSTVLTPDICIIGAGPAGLALATRAAAYGASVVVVEKAEPGGRRLAAGSLALRAFAAAAARAGTLRDAPSFGISAGEPEAEFAALMRHVREALKAAAPPLSEPHLAALGVRLVRGEGRFTSRRMLVAGETEIRARRYVLATGSRPKMPDIPGLSTIEPLTENTIFDLRRRPVHLMVMGGDDHALVFAQAFRRLGSKVTLVAAGAALPGYDPEMAAVVLRQLRADGVGVFEQTRIVEVERRGRAGFLARIEGPGGHDQLNASHMLVAAGRQPALDGLDLLAGRIAQRGEGLDLSRMLRTTNRRVYAIGDARCGATGQGAGSWGGDAEAVRDAERLLRALLFRLPVRRTELPAPRLLGTEPELLQLGLTEAEAMARHRRVRIVRQPVSTTHRALAERRSDGHLKLVLDRRGSLLGVSIAGQGAGEMAGLWQLALAGRIRLEDIGALSLPHGSWSEIGKQAAMPYFPRHAEKPALRFLARMLRVLG